MGTDNVIKILQITLSGKGGMVHYTSQLSNAISKKAEVYLVASSDSDFYLFDKSINLVQIDFYNSKKSVLLNTILIHRALSFLRKIYSINPDVIHLQSFHPWMCLFLPFLKKFRIITTIHDVTPHPGSRKFIQKVVQPFHIKYSDALIVHGSYAKTKLEENVSQKEIFVIPHGDYSFFTKLGISDIEEEAGNVLFFGRIADYKGLHYLIQAVPKIARFIPNLKVVIAGSGDFEEKEYVENNPYFELNNRFIEDAEVATFFQKASVVVLPYIECTQTGIIPIAYAFKKPVVVTNVGCIPDVVENGRTGFIIPPKDPDSLADALIDILKDESLRKEMGKNAYIKMKKELSWDSIAEKTFLVYTRVLEKREKIID
ncbi:MAG: glycosyltransferase family 4 protein [Methanosarcinaceae archaeon]|nr:glycosyltransferase family 4 protein [Methanosarcinaceae archaeon]MDD4496652.1 glycosyltransferase family 4 protein [Methanosarcinaceae archaeon]